MGRMGRRLPVPFSGNLNESWILSLRLYFLQSSMALLMFWFYAAGVPQLRILLRHPHFRIFISTPST